MFSRCIGRLIPPRIKQLQPSAAYSYRGSKLVQEVIGSQQRKFEESSSAEEWRFVERLLGPPVVPQPSARQEYPSGWAPQKPGGGGDGRAFHVERTKNHMQPVYLVTSHRGQRRVTVVRRVLGDIWQLEERLKQHLGAALPFVPAFQVNEFAGFVAIKGDHVSLVKQFLDANGL